MCEMSLTVGSHIDLTMCMSKGTRIRLTGKRRNSKHGPLLVTADGDVWVLEDTEGSKLHVGSDLVVEGIQTGFDRIQIEWSGNASPQR